MREVPAGSRPEAAAGSRPEVVGGSRLVARPAWIAAWTRVPMLLLVAALSLLGEPGPLSVAWCLLVAAAAVPGLLVRPDSAVTRLGRVAETAVAAYASVRTGGALGATLPYLAAPVLAAGLLAGTTEAVALVVLAALLVVGTAYGRELLDDPLLQRSALQWLVLVAVVALVSGVAGRALRASRHDPEPAYAEATRLLTQLRTVARQLPGTLDPGGIAERLLDEVRGVAPADRAAVFTGGGGRLVVLAQSGPDRVDWETSLDADTPLSEAWASQQPQTTHRSLARTAPAGDTSALALPLVTGVRTVGMVVLESDRPGAYPPSVVLAARERVSQGALRLETALLFDEVRSLATTEERQRLAREIHDGVAQELVMVGYGIDSALAQLPPRPAGDGTAAADAAAAELTLRTLREEVTRVITELRLSLFELRSDVDRSGGLGTAIADYARTVAASAGLRVHLSLDESSARLPAAVEAELLRVAQEAVTNARKHASAANLWVTCEVDPPYARVEVTDDGQGLGPRPREGSYGMAIMRERAERVRARLEIEQRDPHGTRVAVTLGVRPGHGSVRSRQGGGPGGGSGGDAAGRGGAGGAEDAASGLPPHATDPRTADGTVIRAEG